MDSNAFYILRDICVFFAALMLVKYVLFLVIAPWYQVKMERHNRLLAYIAHKKLSYKPLVSVIIPAWNEEVGILQTVRSLLKNTYDNTEIVIVNDGSTDNSHGIITAFLETAEATSRPGIEICYVNQEQNGGKGVALNNGIKNARGSIVVTMDADSQFDKHALERIVRHFSDSRVDALVGNVKVANNKSLIGYVQSLEYLFGFYYKRAYCVLGAEYIYGGACAAFRKKKTFDQIGLFDEANKTEDIEMSLRTKYYGLRSVYAEDVICYTEGASTIRGLMNQRLRWKKGRFDTFLRYRSMIMSRHGNHNKWLSWFVMPFSLLGEIQLLFEPIGISLLVTYCVVSGDYISLALGSLFVWLTYVVNALFGHTFRPHRMVLFAFTWPLFYFLVWVEYVVLLKSIWMVLRGHDIQWQAWNRQGIDS